MINKHKASNEDEKESHEYCEISSTCSCYLHLNKITSKTKSKIFTSVNSI